MNTLHPLDWGVVALYGAIVVAIGAWANRGTRTSESYFVAGRDLKWWAVGASLIATSFSSAALIGGTGQGFSSGLSYLQLQLGDLVAIGIACVVFLPYFARMRTTTAYEYLEHRFGVSARVIGSLLFMGQTLLRAAILVYGPALALATLLDWPVEAAIAVTAAAAIVYSVAGGIAAVVWTDLMQLGVVIVGVVISIAIVAGDVPGGLGTVLADASEAGRLEVFSLEFDAKSIFNLPGTLIAYGVLALSIAGTNQQAVQRYACCKDLASARRAALLGWTVGAVAVGLTLFLGVSLWSYTQHVPGVLDPELTGDAVLPAFVAARLPAGVAGLIVAAIFAASMSSLDSAIHSLSTATLVDFVRRFRTEPLSTEHELRLARLLTIEFGLLAAFGAVYAAAADTGLLNLLIRWLGYFAGPLLGLFLLGMLTKRVGERAALAGTVIAAVVVLIAVQLEVPREWAFHALWLAPVGCAITFGAGCLGSALTPRRERSGTRS